MLARRNAITVLMAIELLLNAVNLNLVAFDVLICATSYGIGQVFTLFIITIAAAETGLGLAIVLLLFRQRGNADIDEQRELAEPLGDRDVAERRCRDSPRAEAGEAGRSHSAGHDGASR